MAELGKWLMVTGVVLAVVGVVVWGLGRSGFQGLLGDIRIEGEHGRFYFPIVTCIVLSILLTGLLWIWRWFNGR
ncbi:MAG: DUF2905 domain-containing protein [Phycisphaerales bacterium]|jgi:hypothetical protein|nr:DUF2905 domain-containing protein [Phycisphaerales bacterium]